MCVHTAPSAQVDDEVNKVETQPINKIARKKIAITLPYQVSAAASSADAATVATLVKVIGEGGGLFAANDVDVDLSVRSKFSPGTVHSESCHSSTTSKHYL
jgi:hypothetical protein